VLRRASLIAVASLGLLVPAGCGSDKAQAPKVTQVKPPTGEVPV
jgi:hypothetical protein